MFRNSFIVITILCIVFGIDTWFSTYKTTSTMQAEAQQIIITKGTPVPKNEFTQDGCTLFPDRFPWHDFRPACLEHDIAYWAGGTDADRVVADLDFYNSIRHAGPLGPVIAPLMYIGVATFGDSWLTKLVGANWGYGNN